MKTFPKFDEFVNESYGEYQVDYYERMGGHGNTTSHKTLKDAIKSAEMLKKESKSDLGTELLYIGVDGGANTDFAVTYVCDEYIKNIIDVHAFKDKEDYNIWVEVANLCKKSGKSQIGNFN